jgi:hypothetical protein
MKRVLVYIPFHRRETDEDCKPGDEFVASEEELARIRAVNVNMVAVLGDVEEPETEATVAEEEGEEPETEAAKKPKRKTKE